MEFNDGDACGKMFRHFRIDRISGVTALECDFELGALTVLKDNNDDKKGTEWREPPPRAYNLVILISGIHRAVC